MPPAGEEATKKMDVSKDVDKNKDKDAKKNEKEEDVEINEEDLSEADRELKMKLEGYLDRLDEDDQSLYEQCLKDLRSEIKTATSSMTSVPKPLKFLRPHYQRIKDIREKLSSPEHKAIAADVISLIATTVDSGERDCLNFRLKGTDEPISLWGHEYVRHLIGEIALEHSARVAAAEEAGSEPQLDDLTKLAGEIVPYCVKNNAEPDACDLLMEIERLDMLEPHVDENCYDRVCLYLMSCVPYVPEPYDEILMKTCLGIFRKFSKWPQAMQVALKLNDMDIIKDIFKTCPDRSTRRQLAFLLGRQQFFFDVEEELDGIEEDDDELEQLRDLMANTHLSSSYLALARELDILEPKSPDDVYKADDKIATRFAVPRLNLAKSFTNAFVNTGFGSDKLILVEQGNTWIYHHKERGRMSAAASLGMLLLWDVDGGLTQIDAYMMSDKEEVKAGALLAIGIVNSTVRNEHEPALALLQDYVTSKVHLFRVSSVMGLGLAYAGTANEIVTELLRPVLDDSDAKLELHATAAIALGQIHVGTGNMEIAEAIVQCLLVLKPEQLNTMHARMIVVAVGLIFMGKQASSSLASDVLSIVPEPYKTVFQTIVESIAYAGTGNVLKIQKLLHMCSEHIEEKEGEEGNNLSQAFATIGIAIVAMGEDIGVEMALRSMNHLLQYGEPVIRRAVPIAMALLCTSNPALNVLDILSKLTHDPDKQVAYNSIFALGIMGAGTNHARIAGMLRHLAQYYSRSNDAMFVIRIAQGLLYTGKGSITLSPFHTERSLLSPAAAAGLLTMLLSLVDVKEVLLGDSHFMLYHLALAMHPRILSLFDEDLNPLSLTVRVGQAVDVVGQAGKPKTITGFVTNNTPVLLGFGERAQLATEEYVPLTPTLEGFVICRKNPDYDEETAAKSKK
ncbi:Psmd2 protein [Salpingoeca rosetta]|uniref:Psmd2 protein n=1 Tax=Salpingoeca rosetta (strain ATCC 50818 / BSB-021) TaxID=946362 RepID=F2UH94_SALR5|nr:Psmd2 protein [Salpingoeca rosetta]EGD76493.1 Psmd2 protein [Salpingoeca rosetta]|eukprot:XP_004991407.1 Psmd2 protein [Salpingoeca rosetta]